MLGAPPLEIVRPKSLHGSIIDPGLRAKRHEDSDSRLLQIAAIIEKRLKRDPGIAETAKAWVERRLLSAEGSERLALREWQDLLRSNSVSRLRRILVQDDERGRRLRQSLPFLEVLSPGERADLFRDSEAT